MSAADDYPAHGAIGASAELEGGLYEKMCDEIDELRLTVDALRAQLNVAPSIHTTVTSNDPLVELLDSAGHVAVGRRGIALQSAVGFVDSFHDDPIAAVIEAAERFDAWLLNGSDGS